MKNNAKKSLGPKTPRREQRRPTPERAEAPQRLQASEEARVAQIQAAATPQVPDDEIISLKKPANRFEVDKQRYEILKLSVNAQEAALLAKAAEVEALLAKAVAAQKQAEAAQKRAVAEQLQMQLDTLALQAQRAQMLGVLAETQAGLKQDIDNLPKQ